MATEQSYLTDMTTAQLQQLVIHLGQPAYRAQQLQRWVYQRLVKTFEEMSDLPAAFRAAMSNQVRLHCLNLVREMTSHDGTVKVLLSLVDGNTIEATMMPYVVGSGGARVTLCLSTQAGCAVGCYFCATGQQGFVRSLSSGEIIEQVLYFGRRLHDKDPGRHITNLVFMGMGEPLANYENLWQAIEMLNSPLGFGLGARNITVSTAGLVPQIRRLSEEKLQVNLAVSLHAATNALRSKLLPVNNRYPLEELIPACYDYTVKTRRRISFEYILFANVNDSLSQARQLAHLVQGLNCHINLIAANRTSNRDYLPPAPEVVLAFSVELNRLRIQCTIREGRGLDIDAGCGQLRASYARQR